MTTTVPAVPLPVGAEPDIWQDHASQSYRVLYGDTLSIAGRDDVLVTSAAIQFANGAIDDGSVLEPPHVYVETNHDAGFTSQQARELAALIVSAADEVDGWAQR